MVTKPAQAIVSFEQARHIVEQHAAEVTPGPAEAVELLAAAGRVLAEEIRADRDLPPFPRATRDGFAVRSADLSELPAKLNVIGEIRAGASAPESALQVGPQQTVEIMTGAPVPAGADAVVMVEYTQRAGERVEIQRSVTSGENVVPRGSESKEGELLLIRRHASDPCCNRTGGVGGQRDGVGVQTPTRRNSFHRRRGRRRR